MLYSAEVLQSWERGLGILPKLLPSTFQGCRPAPLQIKAAKQESKIGISILLRSHAQQPKNAKWVQCNGEKRPL